MKFVFLAPIILCIMSCGYKQVDPSQPHAIFHPVDNLKILSIDGENVISLSGTYIINVTPGPHNLRLNYGNNEKTPAEGSDNHIAQLVIDAKEGIRYYLAPKYNYGKEKLLFSVTVNAVKSWKAIIKKEQPIEDYPKNLAEKIKKDNPESDDETK